MLALAAPPSASCAERPGRFGFRTSSLPVGRGPNAVALVDVNGDRHPDILTANSASRDVSVLLGDGAGRFAAASGSPFALGFAPHLVGSGDFDRDGKTDPPSPATTPTTSPSCAATAGEDSRRCP